MATTGQGPAAPRYRQLTTQVTKYLIARVVPIIGKDEFWRRFGDPDGVDRGVKYNADFFPHWARLIRGNTFASSSLTKQFLNNCQEVLQMRQQAHARHSSVPNRDPEALESDRRHAYFNKQFRAALDILISAEKAAHPSSAIRPPPQIPLPLPNVVRYDLAEKADAQTADAPEQTGDDVTEKEVPARSEKDTVIRRPRRVADDLSAGDNMHDEILAIQEWIEFTWASHLERKDHPLPAALIINYALNLISSIATPPKAKRGKGMSPEALAETYRKRPVSKTNLEELHHTKRQKREEDVPFMDQPYQPTTSVVIDHNANKVNARYGRDPGQSSYLAKPKQNIFLPNKEIFKPGSTEENTFSNEARGLNAAIYLRETARLQVAEDAEAFPCFVAGDFLTQANSRIAARKAQASDVIALDTVLNMAWEADKKEQSANGNLRTNASSMIEWLDQVQKENNKDPNIPKDFLNEYDQARGVARDVRADVVRARYRDAKKGAKLPMEHFFPRSNQLLASILDFEIKYFARLALGRMAVQAQRLLGVIFLYRGLQHKGMLQERWAMLEKVISYHGEDRLHLPEFFTTGWAGVFKHYRLSHLRFKTVGFCSPSDFMVACDNMTFSNHGDSKFPILQEFIRSRPDYKTHLEARQSEVAGAHFAELETLGELIGAEIDDWNLDYGAVCFKRCSRIFLAINKTLVSKLGAREADVDPLNVESTTLNLFRRLTKVQMNDGREGLHDALSHILSAFKACIKEFPGEK